MRKSSPAQYGIRVLIYCGALFLMALGVALSVNGNLGISPVNSLPYVVSQILPVQMGTCVTVLCWFYVLLQAVILRREFHPVNLLQVLFSTVFGYFVDFAKLLVGDFALPSYVGRLVMLASSIFLIALGVVLYMDAELVLMPTEGLATCLAKKLGKPFPSMKTAVDCVIVLTGMVLCFLFLGKLDGIREGTVITAVMVGRTVAVLRKWISPTVKRICFGE